jgi:hypothetical protein
VAFDYPLPGKAEALQVQVYALKLCVTVGRHVPELNGATTAYPVRLLNIGQGEGKIPLVWNMYDGWERKRILVSLAQKREDF